MSLESELKRRLDISDQPLAKRLRLAENVISSSYFPVLNKDELVLDWIFSHIQTSNNSQERDSYFISLRNNITKSINYKNFTSNFKLQVFKTLSEYLKRQDIQKEIVIECCLNFLENPTVNSHLQHYVVEYMSFQALLLSTLYENRSENACSKSKKDEIKDYEMLVKRSLTDISNFVKNFGKKTILAQSFIDSKALNIVLQFSNDSRFAYKALNICQAILFPKPSLQIYRSYLGALIKGANIDSLIEEKGESLRTIFKVLDFLVNPNDNKELDWQLLSNFVKLFIYCCKNEEMLVYFFNIILLHCIGIEQDYVQIHGKVSKINKNTNFIQKIYLDVIDSLSEYNVNLNISFTNDTNSDNDKSYITYLQHATLSILNDKISMESLLIVKSIILLDPAIFEPLISKMLPKICVQRKNEELLATYNSMMITVLQIQFKLSRGTEFVPKLIQFLKSELESIDKEQSDYLKKAKEVDNFKYVRKIITHQDVFTRDFCVMFGKLGSELMSWQNVNILNSLGHIFEVDCLQNISSDNCIPSVILMTQLLCSLMNSFFFHTKMADQGLTQTMAKKFIENLEYYESKILGKFGRCVMISNESKLMQSFLELCYTYGQFKLLLCKYQPHFTSPFVLEDGSSIAEKKARKIGDMSMLHPYLGGSEWKELFNVVKNLDGTECKNNMNRLILQKLTILQLCEENEYATKSRNFIRTYIFENIDEFWNIILENDSNGGILFHEITADETKLFVNKIIDKFLNSDSKFELDILRDFMNRECVKNNKKILSELTLELCQSLWMMFEKQKNMTEYVSLMQASQANDFDFKVFLKESILNINGYLKNLMSSKLFKRVETLEKISHIIEFVTLIPVEHLSEKYQHMVIFNAIVLKLIICKSSDENEKKLVELDYKIERVLYKIYGMSYKTPNILNIFPFEILVENDVFQISCYANKKYLNHGIILKHTFERLVSKEHFHHFKGILKYLKKESSLFDLKTSKEKVKCSIFQIVAALFACLANFKKVSLPSDMKNNLLNIINDVKDIISGLFNSIKWKSLVDSSAVDVPDVTIDETVVNLDNSLMSSDLDFDIAKLNLMECYALLVQFKLDSNEEEDMKSLKCLKKGLKLFISLAKICLSNPESSLQHVRGASSLLHVLLKNFDRFDIEKVSTDRETFLTDTFEEIIRFIQNNEKHSGNNWTDVLSVNLENIKLIFELTDDKVFSKLVSKYCGGDISMLESNITDSKSINTSRITKILWTCLLNSNLKSNKSHMRLNILNDICGSFRALCQDFAIKQTGDLADDNETKYVDETEDLAYVKPVGAINLKGNAEKIAVCFGVACQFVSMKKIPLPSHVVDIIIQMPLLLSIDASNDQLSTDGFKNKFEMCTDLVNSLLIHRSEILQDRWPCFLQAYRKLLKQLCLRSNSDKIIDNEDVEKLVSLARIIEKITQSMVKNEKQELSRISSYLIADVINNYHKIPIVPEVKFHIEKCVYTLFDLLDTHSIGFLMRNMQDSQRLIFQQMHQNYNKYHKYTGAS